jgi:hypothetical protein
LIEDKIPDNVCELINNKLYICYNNVKKQKKVVKSIYKDLDSLVETIIRSCFVPFLIDGNLLLKNKYIDGIIPYIFDCRSDRKILYLDLYGSDKIANLINVKNERTNYHRILSGLLDIHHFFIKQTSTQMCSFVNNWTIVDKIRNSMKWLFERIVLYSIFIAVFIKSHLSSEMKKHYVYKFICKSSKHLFGVFLETYCL